MHVRDYAPRSELKVGNGGAHDLAVCLGEEALANVVKVTRQVPRPPRKQLPGKVPFLPEVKVIRGLGPRRYRVAEFAKLRQLRGERGQGVREEADPVELGGEVGGEVLREVLGLLALLCLLLVGHGDDGEDGCEGEEEEDEDAVKDKQGEVLARLVQVHARVLDSEEEAPQGILVRASRLVQVLRRDVEARVLVNHLAPHPGFLSLLGPRI
mmetsp:Transcript_20077/g.50185  ORF Transcript_20077/g.50185 Transcript_20077/m.50185 type:complete len:211 (-) Transcript_20077:287-919(-)